MVSKQDQPRRATSRARADSAAVAPPCAMVIFGAGGDLTKRLVVPALYALWFRVGTREPIPLPERPAAPIAIAAE